MRFAYYPGCSAKASTRELDRAAHWLAEALRIELVELVDAGCCGSCEIKNLDPERHLLLNARILSLAATQNLEILTVCDTCQANLLQTSRLMRGDVDASVRIVRKLEGVGVRYPHTPMTRHFLTIMMEEFGIERLRGLVTRSLQGVRVAPFACCHAFRGPGASPGARGYLDDAVRITGAEVVPVRLDSDCCGFHVLMSNEALSAKASGKFLSRCVDMGADCVVTSSPLCHTALDMFQRKAEAVTGRRLDVPVLHVEQLLGLAMGASPKTIGLDRHLVSARGLLDRLTV